MAKRIKQSRCAVWEGCDWLPLLEVHRSGKAVIYGCGALEEFSETCLGFVAAEGKIRIRGEKLTLLDYAGQTAVLTGSVRQIELIGKDVDRR